MKKSKMKVAGDDNNNFKSRSTCSSLSSSSSSSSKLSSGSLTSHSSGSYSLVDDVDDEDGGTASLRYDCGYDPWRKFSLRSKDHVDDDAFINRVIRKPKNLKTLAVQPSKSKESSSSSTARTPTTATTTTITSGHCSCSPVSPSTTPTYCGLYEKAMDEKLELEFDDDLELFDTIEHGIHGSTAAELDVRDGTTGGELESRAGFVNGFLNASYDRDINPWTRYSELSTETLSNEAWSDSYFSDTNSEDILNDNFVLPLLKRTRPATQQPGGGTTLSTSCSKAVVAVQADYHWRTVVEP